MKHTLILFVLLIGTAITQASIPIGWTFNSTAKDYKIYMDKTAGRNGKEVPAIKSVKNIKEEEGAAYFIQECIADKYKGKRVRMSGYMKSEIVTGWAAFLLRGDGNSTITFAFDIMANRPIKGTTDWTKYDIVLDIPDSVNQLAYGAALNGNGKIWIDDITFEIVDNSVPVTSVDHLYGTHYVWKWHGAINLDFDTLSKIDTVFKESDGWQKGSEALTGYKVDIDKGNGMNGSNAATIQSLGVKDKWSGSLFQFFLTGKYAGKRMRMTGYMCSENVDKWAGFWMSVYGPYGTGKAPVSVFYSTDKFKGTKGWTKCEIVFDVPLNSYALILGARLNGKGQVWIDNISFEIIGDVSTATKSGKESTMLNGPINLDFTKR